MCSNYTSKEKHSLTSWWDIGISGNCGFLKKEENKGLGKEK